MSLGQTRLQIVGTAARGAQPLHDERHALVFNGEIHNYLELAADVGAPAVSDTEVLFALLKTHGKAALSRLRGFWALAFVDFAAGTILLARDRYGQKPLLYTRRSGGYAFASEASALGVSLTPVRAAVSRFIATGHYPPAPVTFYEGIAQLRPGHVIALSLDGRTPPVESAFYELPPLRTEALPDFGAAAAHFEALLRRSLDLRLRADVPVGLTLSAGKDSGTLAALLPASVRQAFTFDNRAADGEAAEVRAWYARRFDLHVSTVDEFETDLARRVDAMHARLDAPLASGALLALDGLYRDARHSGVPVVLSGQGADELLGGYNYYAELQPHPAQALGARLATLGGPAQWWLAYRDQRATQSLLSFAEPPPPASMPSSAGGDLLNARQRYDLADAPLQTMLWYEDRLAMAHSVEARYPFLDVALVDYCLSLPGSYHVEGFARKRLLHAAFAKTWPAALRRQRLKRGLPAAEARLLAGFPAWTSSGLRRAADYFSVPAPTASPSGPRHAKALFRLVVTGHWLRLHGEA